MTSNRPEMHVGPEHRRMVGALMRQTRAAGGLAPVDVERFWADQQVADKDPFGARIPQCPLGIMMDGECVFAELGIGEDYWRYEHDEPWRLSLNKAYNDISQRIVGRRLLDEKPDDPGRRSPAIKGLHDIFEARNEWHDRAWWLMQCAHDEDELKALLDRVDAKDVRREILPDNWDQEKARLKAHDVPPSLYRAQRGPVTFAMSVYGVENLIYLIADNEKLAERFSRTILRVMLDIARVLDEEAGCTPATSPRGFRFADDNCALLAPGMYELFGWPVLKGVWDVCSPGVGDERYQHSDSAMGHLLPLLGRLDLTGVNFGPTVMVDEIRRHLPRAVIDGQLAPYTFSMNEQERIVAEFLRDFSMAREKRGLRFCTAGSINNGSRLTGMRLIMAAIQRYGQYQALR